MVGSIVSGLAVALVFAIGLCLGYCRGINLIRQQAVDRKLASWKRIVVGHNTHSPIIVEKFTWIGEEQDGK